MGSRLAREHDRAKIIRSTITPPAGSRWRVFYCRRGAWGFKKAKPQEQAKTKQPFAMLFSKLTKTLIFIGKSGGRSRN